MMLQLSRDIRVSLLVMLVLFACSGKSEADVIDATELDTAEVDTGHAVDTVDPLWDGPIEWDVSPSVPLPTDGEACGMRSDGTYEPCHLQLAADWVSTLCDEARATCVAPVANCQGGWCYIPPRGYLARATYEFPVPGYGLNVSVPRGVFITQTVVTFGQFERVMGYLPDTDTRCGPDCPAAGVTTATLAQVELKVA